MKNILQFLLPKAISSEIYSKKNLSVMAPRHQALVTKRLKYARGQNATAHSETDIFLVRRLSVL